MKLSSLSSLLLLLPAFTQAGHVVPIPASHRHLQDRILPDSILVELSGNPEILGGDLAAIEAQHTEFKKALTDSGVNFQVRGQFGKLINGLSLQLDVSRSGSISSDVMETIAGLPQVDKVFPNFLVDDPAKNVIIEEPGPIAGRRTLGPDFLAVLPHNDTGVTQVHQEFKVTGKGIKVGIIDTGIDYKHPAFGSCSAVGQGAKCRVMYGMDFVGDGFGATGLPRPDKDPMDCGGHGTHVAGSVAGRDDKLLGVAPDAILGAYKVFGCEGGTTPDAIIAGMEKAYEDGMDVINLSLGRASQWPEFPTATAITRLSDKGMIVVAAMGNEGSLGLWEAGAPAVGIDAIAVASSDNAMYLFSAFNLLQSGKDVNGQKYLYNTPVPLMKVQIPDQSKIIVASLLPGGDLSADGCKAPSDPEAYRGKMVLIKRGTCTFAEKVLLAQAAKAEGVFIYNNQPGMLEGAGGLEGPDVEIPVGLLSLEDGEAITEAVKKVSEAEREQFSFSFLEEMVPQAVPTKGQISDFSSWGLSPDLAIKPDVTAPGGKIFSSWPTALGSYNTISGTSMASPYAAGVAALYLSGVQAGLPVQPLTQGKLARTRELKQYLQNNAVPIVQAGNVAGMSSVARQGAGLLNAYNLFISKTAVSPSALSLGYLPPQGIDTITASFSVSNTGDLPTTYSLYHEASVSVNGTDSAAPTLASRPATVTIEPASFTLGPKEQRSVTVSIRPDVTKPDLERWLYSGYIKVQPENSAKAVFVPYAGLKGDYRSYPVFGQPGTSDQPYVRSGTSRSPTFSRPDETATFSFTGEDIPLFYIKLLHPTPLLSLSLFREGKEEKSLGYVAYEPNQGRTASEDQDPEASFLEIEWPTTIRGRPAVFSEETDDPAKRKMKAIPAGSYYVVARAVKALGDEKKDFEYWRSPKIVIEQ